MLGTDGDSSPAVNYIVNNLGLNHLEFNNLIFMKPVHSTSIGFNHLWIQ